uniref:CSON013483 protein n=1 Tax=Culicoides sonorensis TaxID=179676 RepID=A0A336LR06_CULSO
MNVKRISLNDLHLNSFDVLKKVQNLKEIYLNNVKIENLHKIEAIQNVTLLSMIDTVIGISDIKHILRDIKTIKFLNIEMIFHKMNKTQTIDNPLLEHSNLNYFGLVGYAIETLGTKTFDKFASSLISLNLSRNLIEELHDSIFASLTDLRTLDLSFNKIKHLKIEILPLSIQNLNLSWNFLTEFGQSIKGTSYSNLRNLHLSHNLLKKFILPNKNMSQLSLDHNYLTDLELWKWTVTQNQSHTIINLKFNTPKCSCEFKRLQKNLFFKSDNFEYCILDEIDDRIVTEMMPCVKKDDLVDYIDLCPIYTRVLNFTCDETALHETVINCTNKNITNFSTEFMKKVFYNQKLSKKVSFYLDQNPFLSSLPRIPSSYWVLPSTEFNIYAMNSGIEYVNESNIMRNLKLLNVTGNKIRKMHLKVLEKLKMTKIGLSRNPIECSCEEYKNMKEFSMIFSDYNEITCDDGIPISIDRTICVDIETLSLYVCLTILMVILIIILIIVNYSMEIRVLIHTRLKCFTKNKNYSNKMKYNAFISFVQEDEELVKQIINHLECQSDQIKDERNIRFCIHLRDWQIGKRIDRQIAESIENSEKTIVILSKNFINSFWGHEEFKLAYCKAMEGYEGHLIMIIHGDLKEISNKLKPEMRSYVKTHTYLKWDDKWFWDKLKYALMK